MKSKLAIFVLIAGLAGSLTAASSASSQEPEKEPSQEPVMMGGAGIEGRLYDVNGNEAKFHEYSDIKSGGAFVNADVTYVSPNHFIWLQVTDPGYDTQRYRLETGSFGKYKFWFDYNEIIHNITSDAKTFYSGAGTNQLTGTPNTEPATWRGDFDYSTKRKRIDAGIKFDLAQPFFFNISFPYEKKEGIKPAGVSTSSSRDAALELPEPVDYRTSGLRVDAGYSLKPFLASLSYSYGEFRNDAHDLLYDVPDGWTPGPLSLPPDSEFYKFNFKGSAKLPWDSKFNINISDEKTKSDTSSFTDFKGKVDTRIYDFMASTYPFRFLEGRIYYKYYERDNTSTGSTLINSVLVPTRPLSYEINTYGAEAGFRLPAKLHLNAGYKYTDTERSIRHETDPAAVLPHNEDHIFFTELKWTGLDFLSARLAYEGMNRKADYRTDASEDALNQQFAYAAQKRDTFKATVDLFPINALNMSFEYRFRRSNYDETIFGYTADTRNATGFTLDYAFRKLARFFGYLDLEKRELWQRALLGSDGWVSKQDEKTYACGIKTDVYAIPQKLTFTLQYDYLKSDGFNDFDFTSGVLSASGIPDGLPVDIPDWDDYTKSSFTLTAVYNWSEAILLKGGYTYARYDYTDDQLKHYRYYAGGDGSSQGYLTGAYNDTSYEAHIAFLSLVYRFR
ncbi:MAG: MtrB/PioB family outer membrane beta-barrel protein [Smithella sp.]